MKRNIFESIPADLPEEVFETLLTGRRWRVERIVSRGHRSPPGFWYDQEDDEWVLLLKGRAVLKMAESAQPLSLRPGDYLLIPAHTRHRLEWTPADEDTVWLAIHYRNGL